uniref:Cytochrome c oxidase subunit 2 n=1 Tax=Morphostenophanes yunnanus TaxID=2823840 RepID=A0A8F4PK86_9CUCU|nr:cytochrome c oxidase subunit II [Morphostenophanes yunnanus]QXF60325.1 cytochrome oxidase c subunit 2 [Morphostenophanes yunnanus]
MATWKLTLLQDSASPLMEQLAFFHDHTLLILITITILVSQVMAGLFINKFTHRFLLEGQTIELIWTILPAITLIFIALPSLRLIYILDETSNPAVSIKTVGHQWYWSYEYSDFKNTEFDSYMIPTTEPLITSFRLLDVDNRMVVPFSSHIRMLISAADVIHSWTLPSMGVKVDATPGRLNQVAITTSRSSVFFGQCSEICGANHSFMPIVVESISPSFFIKWISKIV